MTILRFDSGLLRDARRPAAPQRPTRAEPLPVFDVWPDIATELTDAETQKAARDNRPEKVFAEIFLTVTVSVGLVVLLMAVLAGFHFG